jgi:hypothetical protein
LRNSWYVIFGISCSFSDPFKDLNMIGKFARLLSDCSEELTPRQTCLLENFDDLLDIEISSKQRLFSSK